MNYHDDAECANSWKSNENRHFLSNNFTFAILILTDSAKDQCGEVEWWLNMQIAFKSNHLILIRSEFISRWERKKFSIGRQRRQCVIMSDIKSEMIRLFSVVHCRLNRWSWKTIGVWVTKDDATIITANWKLNARSRCTINHIENDFHIFLWKR